MKDFTEKSEPATNHLVDDRRETLFIDPRLEKITSTYHVWRGSRGGAEQKKTSASESLRVSVSPREHFDILGFGKSATTAKIASHLHVLTPNRCQKKC